MQLSVDRPPVKPPSPFLPAPVPVHCGAHFSRLYKYTYKNIDKNTKTNTNAKTKSFSPILPAPLPECIQQPGNQTRLPYSMSRSDISVLSFISAGSFVAGIGILNQHQKIIDIALFSVTRRSVIQSCHSFSKPVNRKISQHFTRSYHASTMFGMMTNLSAT